MRGDDEQQAPMWSYISAEQRAPADHPLGPCRRASTGSTQRRDGRPSRGHAVLAAAVVLAVGAVPGARTTLATDKGHDTPEFVTMRALGITPHVAQHTTKRLGATDSSTPRRVG